MSKWSDFDRAALALSVCAIGLLCLVTWFSISLDELLTPFIIGPLYLGLIVALFVLFVFWLQSAMRRRPGGLGRIALAIACIGILVASFIVPVERIQMRMDFRQHRAQREAVAKRVLATGATDLVKLEPDESGLSRGGDEVFVDPVGGHRFVVFYFKRGILDSYSAFLYVPPGASIDEYTKAGTVRAVEQLADGWYSIRGV